MLTIIQAETPEQIAEAREIFRDYEEWLGVSLGSKDSKKSSRRFPANMPCRMDAFCSLIRTALWPGV